MHLQPPLNFSAYTCLIFVFTLLFIHSDSEVCAYVHAPATTTQPTNLHHNPSLLSMNLFLISAFCFVSLLYHNHTHGNKTSSL